MLTMTYETTVGQVFITANSLIELSSKILKARKGETITFPLSEISITVKED